jgi:hypothetical protein
MRARNTQDAAPAPMQKRAPHAVARDEVDRSAARCVDESATVAETTRDLESFVSRADHRADRRFDREARPRVSSWTARS